MKFNPDARIDSSRIDDTGGALGGSGRGGGLPVPLPQSGGGRIGLVLMVLGLVVRWWRSRRTSRAVS
jgi:hypothetical protein